MVRTRLMQVCSQFVTQIIVPRFEIQENIHNGQSRLFFDISNSENHFARLFPGQQSCLNLTAYVRVSDHISLSIHPVILCIIEQSSFHSNTCPCCFFTSLLQVERLNQATNASNFQLDDLSAYPVIVSSSLTITVSLYALNNNCT